MATSPTPQSGQPVQVGSGNQLAAIQELLGLLFGSPKQVTGQTTTSNPGDISGLQALLTQLQGADYQQLLQGIFQQAAGQIPGFQQAYGNAVGARSGNNSAVAANMERLLMETALAGAQQTTQAQLQNQQLQAQAAGNIAQATRGTQQTTTQSSKTKGQGAELAGLIGLAQAALKLTGSRDLQDLWGKMGGGARSPVAGAPGATQPFNPNASNATMQPQGQQPITAAAAPSVGAGGRADPFAAFLSGGSVPDFSNVGQQSWNQGMMLDPRFQNFSDMFAFQANEASALTGQDPLDALINITNGFGTMPAAPMPVPDPVNWGSGDYGFGGGVDEFYF